MMMMPSSSSSSTPTMVGQQAPKLVRHNSSFLGAIKNIVTAPLSWFGNADSGADVTGSKRRRPESGPAPMAFSGIQEAPTEIIIDERSGSGQFDRDETSRRSKRMRLSSPSRTMTKSGYLMRRSSVVPRASSAVLPSSRGASRATLSPKRNAHLYPSALQRTMSIDPPQFASRRDAASASFNFSVDVDMVGFDSQDISIPPSPSRLSPRPSFRMRGSMTPQPVQHTLPQRHISEPPPLNALFSNPVFVHPPPQDKEATSIPAPVATLGTLVESARNIRLPVKHQRASLLFNRHDEVEVHRDVPAERALQQLDIYKTPLLPSRMRSDANSITAGVIPDMFKSRRASRPVLMSDDREKSSTKKNKGPVVNETKPYAGEGGMKKLLARAKLEAEKENAKEPDEDMDNTREEVPEPSSVPLPPPPPVTSDWFKSAVSGTSTSSSSGSALRVGRQKTSRNHIQRPSKSRFSAVYEDEGDDVAEDDERAKERRMLEEAAKKVPTFNISPGFSFAQDTPAPVPTSDDLQKAKEPPIKSLPFSLFKSSTPSDSAPKASEPAPPTSIFGTDSSEPRTTTSLPFSFEKPISSAPTSSAATPTSGAKVPNFFATSQLLRDQSLRPPHVLNFDAPSAASIPPSTSTSNAGLEMPVTDAEKQSLPNIFAGPTATPSLFPPISERTAAKSSVVAPAPFMFGKAAEDTAPPSLVESKPAAAPFTFEKTAEEQKAATSPFSFGNATKDKSALTTTATTSSSAPSTLPFGFGKPAVVQEKPSATSGLPFSLVAAGEATEKKPEAAAIAPNPLFEPSTASTSTISSAPQSTTSLLYGVQPRAASPFTGVPPQSTPSPLPFTFGPSSSGPAPTSTTSTETAKPPFSFGSTANTSSASTNAPPLEAPKPLFTPFSFGPEKKQPVESSPFSFASAPSTPVPEVKPASAAPAPFTFGPSSSSTSAPAAATPPLAFSFSGGGSAGTDVTTKSPFMFGVPSGAAAHLERPVTPPKTQDQEVRMEESPVREMHGNRKTLEDSTAMSASFSFASAASNGTNGSTLFGSTPSGLNAASTTTPFTFGAFASKKPEETKPFGGFGAPPINTSFSFSKDESRPTSAFTFGQTPTSATNPTPAFAFGASPNPFAAATSSTPGSPSTFGQPTPFTFGPQAATTSSFPFGSQPSSPAGGANLTLPTSSTSTTFGSGGFGQTPSPASPFTAPLPLAQSTSSGGALFTIGAPPLPPPVGQRQIKKLPRRGNVKR